jgi:hypothetical protein
LGSPVQVEFLKKTFLTEEFQMKAFVSSLAALFLAVGVIGCGGDSGSGTTESTPATPEHEAMMTEGTAEGHSADGAAEGEAAAPAEGDAAAPAEGDAAAPAEGDAAAPAEGDAAAPAEGEAKTE